MNELKNLIVNEMAKPVIMSLPEVHKKFRQYFNGCSFCHFMDGQLSVAYGEPKIDITKFENYLREEHGANYDADGLSMEEFLTGKYGKEAARFIWKLL
jgi:hypothetical protein